MATSFLSDDTNNLVIVNGEFAVISAGGEVAQNVAERLRSYFNDWFLDRDQGVPYFQEIFVKPFDITNSESILKQTILQTPGVQALELFSSSFDGTTRGWTVTAQFTTIFNTVEEVNING